jgi:short-subunit dehydrogenase
MFSDCLRAELDAADVGLTTICPGVINTNMISNTRFDTRIDSSEHVDGRRGQLDKMFSLRRYGPDKVANAIVSAVKKNKPIRPVTFEAYALYGVSRVLPQALRSTARVRVI